MTDSITLTFDRTCTSIDALQRAVYAMADRVSANIATDEGTWVCELFPRGGDADGEELKHAFRTELNDQELRLRIGAQTEGVRNLIFSLAFSRTGLVEDRA